MRTLKIVALMIIITAATTVAQDDSLHQLLTRLPADTCYAYWYNTACLVPEYHARGQYDSIDIIIDAVDDKCHWLEPRFDDYRTLRLIQDGELPNDWCSGEIDTALFESWKWSDFGGCFEFAQPCFDSYDDFIDSLAGALSATVDSTTLEHLVCRYYAGIGTHYILGRLKRNGYPGTCYQQKYDLKLAAVEYDLQRHRIHAAFNAGVWNPLGNTDALGTKVEVGGEIGFRKDRFGIDGTILVRFLDNRENYEFYLNNAVVTSREKFLGGYVGASVVHTVYSQMKYGVELFGGIGYDGIEARYEDDKKTLNSLNLNTGLTFRYFFNDARNKFYGVQLRISHVDYNTGGGSDLSGATISLNVIYGYLGNSSVTARAEHLGYY